MKVLLTARLFEKKKDYLKCPDNCMQDEDWYILTSNQLCSVNNKTIEKLNHAIIIIILTTYYRQMKQIYWSMMRQDKGSFYVANDITHHNIEEAKGIIMSHP